MMSEFCIPLNLYQHALVEGFLTHAGSQVSTPRGREETNGLVEKKTQSIIAK
jgi:hypothetical protein